MDDFINKIPKKIRWIIALPIAVICSWLARWLALTCYYLWMGVDPNDWWPFVLGSFTETAVLVYVFYFLVPSNKFLASIILSSAWGGFILYSTFFVLVNQQHLITDKLFDLLNNFVALIVIILMNIAIYKEGKKDDKEIMDM